MKSKCFKVAALAIGLLAAVNIPVLSFAQETVTESELDNVEMMAHDIERMIGENSSLICDDGTIMGSDCFDANVNIVELPNDVYMVNATVDVFLPSATTSITISGQTVDSTSSIRLYLTLHISRQTINNVSYGILSSVNGSSTALQPGTSVTGGTVRCATYGGSTTGGIVNQVITPNVGSSFSVSTGFKHYVNLVASYNIGAVWNATITRGGSSWTCSLPVSY